LYRYAGEASDDIDNLYSLDSFMEALNEVGGCTSWMQLNAVEYSWMQLNAVECSWIQLNVVECSWIQLNAVEYSLASAWFQPWAYEVKTWFQSLLFTCTLYRYSSETIAAAAEFGGGGGENGQNGRANGDAAAAAAPEAAEAELEVGL
jgi:hypothetical protein